MARESEQDVLPEGGEPHHPLKISRILEINEQKLEIRFVLSSMADVLIRKLDLFLTIFLPK